MAGKRRSKYTGYACARGWTFFHKAPPSGIRTHDSCGTYRLANDDCRAIHLRYRTIPKKGGLTAHVSTAFITDSESCACSHPLDHSVQHSHSVINTQYGLTCSIAGTGTPVWACWFVDCLSNLLTYLLTVNCHGPNSP